MLIFIFILWFTLKTKKSLLAKITVMCCGLQKGGEWDLLPWLYFRNTTEKVFEDGTFSVKKVTSFSRKEFKVEGWCFITYIELIQQKWWAWKV